MSEEQLRALETAKQRWLFFNIIKLERGVLLHCYLFAATLWLISSTTRTAAFAVSCTTNGVCLPSFKCCSVQGQTFFSEPRGRLLQKHLV